jgi:hypothetical protein
MQAPVWTLINSDTYSIGREVGSDEFCTSAILKPPVVRPLNGPTL